MVQGYALFHVGCVFHKRSWTQKYVKIFCTYSLVDLLWYFMGFRRFIAYLLSCFWGPYDIEPADHINGLISSIKISKEKVTTITKRMTKKRIRITENFLFEEGFMLEVWRLDLDSRVPYIILFTATSIIIVVQGSTHIIQLWATTPIEPVSIASAASSARTNLSEQRVH